MFSIIIKFRRPDFDMQFFARMVFWFTAILLIVSVAPAFAEGGAMPCGERTAIIERLSSKYGEQRLATGLNNSGNLIEVFSSVETGSWTILMTSPEGRTCLIAAGEHWDSSPAQSLVGEDA